MISPRQSWSVSLGVAALLAVGLLGCGGADSSPETCAAVAGQVTTSAGGSTGLANYTLSLGSGGIKYSNINNTLYTGTVANQIVDVGAACLGAVTDWPGGGAGPISAIVGDTYVARFPVTTIVDGVQTTVVSYSKFVVTRYSGGVLTVTYVPHL